jgi:hypothetical protein
MLNDLAARFKTALRLEQLSLIRGLERKTEHKKDAEILSA